MFRVMRPHQLVVDVLVAAFCFVVPLPAYVVAHGSATVVLLGMAVSLVFRRWSPPLALGIAWLTSLIQLALGLPPDPSNLAILAVLYGTAAYGDTAVRWSGLGSSVLGALVIAIYVPLQSFVIPSETLAFGALPQVLVLGVVTFFGSLAMLGLSWTLGLLGRTRRLARESRNAEIAAEQARAAAERDALAEQERGRIARDMHDVVAHSLAVIVAQADGARYATAATGPDAAPNALETIASTARAALVDVRALLARLRHDQGDLPQPTLAELPALFEGLRAAGLALEVSETGEPQGLGSGQELAVYRVLQESLTNALRHGSPARATVAMSWSSDGLELAVSNHVGGGVGTGDADDRRIVEGHGLAGMRERATLAGGSLTAEREGEQWTVRARIPRAMHARVSPRDHGFEHGARS